MKSDQILPSISSMRGHFSSGSLQDLPLDDLIHDEYYAHAVKSAIEVICEELKKSLTSDKKTVPGN